MNRLILFCGCVLVAAFGLGSALGMTSHTPPIRLVNFAFIPGYAERYGGALPGAAMTSNQVATGVFGTTPYRFYAQLVGGGAAVNVTTWSNQFWGTNFTAYPFALGYQSQLIVPPGGSYYRELTTGGAGNSNEIAQFMEVLTGATGQPAQYDIQMVDQSSAHAGNANNFSADDICYYAGGGAGFGFELVIDQTYQPVSAPGPYRRNEGVAFPPITHFGEVPVSAYDMVFCCADYSVSNYAAVKYYSQNSNWQKNGQYIESMVPSSIGSTNGVAQNYVGDVQFPCGDWHTESGNNDYRMFGVFFLIYNGGNSNTFQNLSPNGNQ